MLKIIHLTKKFDGYTALENVSLEVNDGEFVCLLGPSGCGKTTLLRMAAGLDAPTDGELLLDDNKIEGVNKECGFVFQEYVLFPWRTVKGNIEFGPEVKGIQKEER